MKIKKILVTMVAALLLMTMTVMGTLAYLTSVTDEVKNTFSVGNVKITLDETKVDTEGTPVEGAARTTENAYKLMPGHSYTKDPTVHVDAASEDSWLFVKVVDEIATIQDTTTVADQMTAKGWTLVAGTTNVYAYKDVVKASDNIVVFENFKLKGDIDNETLAEYAGKTITIQAYAVQADGFTTAADAWAKAPTDWTVTTTPEQGGTEQGGDTPTV